MGIMRFCVHPPQRLTERMVQLAYLMSGEHSAWPAQVTIKRGELIFTRTVSDSARLCAPWPVGGYGEIMLSTGSLIEQTEPYYLPLELARGTLARLRNQLSDWEVLGLIVPEEVKSRLALAVEHFSWASVERASPEASSANVDQALRLALEAGDLLAAAYCEQAIAVRRRNHSAPFILAADLGDSVLEGRSAHFFLAAFNAAVVSLCWRETESTEGNFTWKLNDRQIEWSRSQGLKVMAGPLLLLDQRDLPDWLYLFEGDFESILDSTAAFVQSAVRRYKGRVDYWICAGRMNAAELLSLNEEQRLRLTAQTIEAAHAIDPHTPLLLSVDRPCGEYLRDGHAELTPVQFADVLASSGLPLGGVIVELNLAYYPGGTLLREVIALNRQLDAWATLGLPVWLSICIPSGIQPCPLTRRKSAVLDDRWTPLRQRTWAERLISLALAKNYVQGVIWNQLSDGRPHDFPNGGLLDSADQPKPVLSALAGLRRFVSA